MNEKSSSELLPLDRFAELLSQDIPFVGICVRMKITVAEGNRMLRQIKDGLGGQTE